MFQEPELCWGGRGGSRRVRHDAPGLLVGWSRSAKLAATLLLAVVSTGCISNFKWVWFFVLPHSVALGIATLRGSGCRYEDGERERERGRVGFACRCG